MSIAGIICEYNPFHNGHAYQIRHLKEDLGMDAVVCAMSGNFLQRGEPALLHKSDRTQMALAAGADLILELPALFATRSAYWFALGGVSLLANTGIVTHLAFGAETNDLTALQNTAQLLAKPTADFQQNLRNQLDKGLSFVKAQALALDSSLNQSQKTQIYVPSLPNDRLALSYLQILAETGWSLKPILIQRQGDAYHQATPSGQTAFASAKAIRRQLDQSTDPHQTLSALEAYLPPESHAIIKKILQPNSDTLDKTQIHSQRLVFTKDLEQVLLHILRRATCSDIKSLPDISEGLEHRIYQSARQAVNLDQFYQQLKTKRYSLTRLQRAVLHLYLNYTSDLAAEISAGCPYIRILGFNRKGQALLKQIKHQGNRMLIARSGQLKRLSYQDSSSRNAWELEVRSGDLYALLQGSKSEGSPEHQLAPLYWPH